MVVTEGSSQLCCVVDMCLIFCHDSFVTLSHEVSVPLTTYCIYISFIYLIFRVPCFRIWGHFPWFRHSAIPAFRVARDFLRNMHMKRKKETLQRLRKNMQLKMIFKDHIDRLLTGVRLNNNYDMVCGIIFSRNFTFQISSFNTIRAKTCEIIHLSYDEVSD